MDRLRLAIVGCGSITERGLLPHLELEQDRVEVVALCDVSEQRLKQFAQTVGVRQTYTSFEELLRKTDVEAVAIATPIPLHYEQAKLALSEGRHVYVQKTMTQTAQEAHELVHLASERGLTLAASPGQMLLPAYKRARGLVHDGAIGTTYMAIAVNMALGHEYESLRKHADAQLDPEWYYKKGGGPLRDMGVYSLHAITGILGPVKQVFSLGTSPVPLRHWQGKEISVEVPDNVGVILKLQENRLATVATTYSANPVIIYWGHLAISGSEGTIEVRLLAENSACYELIIQRAGETEPEKIFYGTGLSEKHDQLKEAHVARDLLDFVDAVRNRRSPGASAKHAAHVLEIIEAAELAQQGNKAMDISDVSTFVQQNRGWEGE